jgi:hypothetical protein
MKASMNPDSHWRRKSLRGADALGLNEAMLREQIVLREMIEELR